MSPHEHYVSDAERRVADRLHSPFGNDRFGQMAERFARFFGTPQFIIGQTILVVAWIAVNAVAVSLRWDPYPFILLNLAFSTQAAYAAPLILLAQTRQADRDKVESEHFADDGRPPACARRAGDRGVAHAAADEHRADREDRRADGAQLHDGVCDSEGRPARAGSAHSPIADERRRGRARVRARARPQRDRPSAAPSGRGRRHSGSFRFSSDASPGSTAASSGSSSSQASSTKRVRGALVQEGRAWPGPARSARR